MILATDGYKLGHSLMSPKGIEKYYANLTGRSCGYYPQAHEGYVVLGIQRFVQKYLIEEFSVSFFNMNKYNAVRRFKRRVDTFLGPNEIGTKHIEELHDLGYLPIKIKALPEGTLCPIRVPALTIVNTDNRFQWLVNYLETLMSCELWMPMTSATTARLFKKELLRHAKTSGWSEEQIAAIPFMCHDFSMRGMPGLEAAIISAIGHLAVFSGSETIPAIEDIEQYYHVDAEKYLIAGTIPASEHSVTCANSKENEFNFYKRMLTEVFPNGYLSLVSDTWDYWKVITEYLPQLKDAIMARNGRFVVRPDSGNPVDIICGTGVVKSDLSDTAESKGTYELLWDIFGGYVNEAGYKVLDPHIGIIYGDSITLERQAEIYRMLERKGFAATNLVLGIGSYTYQGKTRDSLGFAVKSTWTQIDGKPVEIFKDPKTDNGVKKSLKGLIQVIIDSNGNIIAKDGCTAEEEDKGLLLTVFLDGKVQNVTDFRTIRGRIDKTF